MLKITEISDKVILFTGTSQVNSTLIEYEDFLIVVDTMLLPKDSKELSSLIRKKNKPVKYILNTHWHSDHCYGNRFVKDENTIIIAHNNFMKTITAEKNVLHPKHKSAVENVNFRFPNLTFGEKMIIKEEPQLHFIYSPGHSYDSSFVFIPKNKIVIAGDTVLNSDNKKIAIPYFYWGNPEQMLLSLEKIMSLKPEIILPGHGNPTNSDKVEQDILYLKNLIQKYQKMAVDLQSKKNLILSESDLIPNTNPDDFWVHKMHTMNIKKMNELFSEKK